MYAPDKQYYVVWLLNASLVSVNALQVFKCFFGSCVTEMNNYIKNILTYEVLLKNKSEEFFILPIIYKQQKNMKMKVVNFEIFILFNEMT